MRKFVEALENGEVTPQSVSLPFTPMNKTISNNPKVVIGISGVRHLQRAGGLAVWPVFYLSKEQVKLFYFNKLSLMIHLFFLFLFPVQ